MYKKLSAVKAAEIEWRRSGESLPAIDDDGAVLGLVKRAQAGDEVAAAGLVALLGAGAQASARRFGWALEAEVDGHADGHGAALSFLWLAIEQYQPEMHPTQVARRLRAGVHYLARRPTRVANVLNVDLFGDLIFMEDTRCTIDVFGSSVEEAVDYIRALETLEDMLETASVSEPRRRVARCLFDGAGTDRVLADELAIPHGSISRHIRELHRVFEPLRGELVA